MEDAGYLKLGSGAVPDRRKGSDWCRYPQAYPGWRKVSDWRLRVHFEGQRIMKRTDHLPGSGLTRVLPAGTHRVRLMASLLTVPWVE